MAAKQGHTGAKLSFDAKRDVLAAYPTPIINTTLANCAALNAGLRRIILAREAEDPGLARSNIGGWHSARDLFDWPEPEIKTLASHIDTLVRQMAGIAVSQQAWKGALTYKAWANVSRSGHYNRMHNHPGAHWSGVYYVDPGDPSIGESDTGKIEFQDPRGFAAMVMTPGNPFTRILNFQPAAGRVLIFPSFMFHTVQPHAGNSERISVAFNAYMGRSHPDQSY